MKELTIFAAVFTTIFTFLSITKTDAAEVVPSEGELTAEKEVLTESFKEKVGYGEASYYGLAFDGKLTANGEIFDCTKMTCASPSLPFNTYVKVTNLNNNKSVLVRVNDRGPFNVDHKGGLITPLEPHPERVLDLSKESFKAIEDLTVGVINIKYEVVRF